MRKRLFPALIFTMLAGCPAFARPRTWQPTAGHTQIRIWPKEPAEADQETYKDEIIRSVSRPTITVYSPQGQNTGAAVVVFPGGGYQVLAILLEGTEACEWLTAHGITAVLLKYRVPFDERYPMGPYRESRVALEDAQRALGLVRFHAAEWKIDPHKIGVLGFSAGGHMVAAMSTQYEMRFYKPVDAADKLSCRPDFAVALYPGHLARHGQPTVLNPHIRVTRQTPPTLLIQAVDDPVDPVANSRVYHDALKKAGVPVEMHLYPHGGHAFGLRGKKSPASVWPGVMEKWLKARGIL